MNYRLWPLMLIRLQWSFFEPSVVFCQEFQIKYGACVCYWRSNMWDCDSGRSHPTDRHSRGQSTNLSDHEGDEVWDHLHTTDRNAASCQGNWWRCSRSGHRCHSWMRCRRWPRQSRWWWDSCDNIWWVYMDPHSSICNQFKSPNWIKMDSFLPDCCRKEGRTCCISVRHRGWSSLSMNGRSSFLIQSLKGAKYYSATRW